jgi:hypothetical protein
MMLARPTSNVNEPARKVATLQIAPKLVLDVLRKRRLVCVACMLQEVREVLLHEPVQDRFLRTAREIGRGEARHGAAAMPSACHLSAPGHPRTLQRLPDQSTGPGQFRLAHGPHSARGRSRLLSLSLSLSPTRVLPGPRQLLPRHRPPQNDIAHRGCRLKDPPEFSRMPKASTNTAWSREERSLRAR